MFQFTSLRTSHGPSGLYNDCKRGEADGPVKENQTSPVPGRLADQGSVSGRSTNKHSDSGGPNTVLGLDNKSGEVRPKANSGVLSCLIIVIVPGWPRLARDAQVLGPSAALNRDPTSTSSVKNSSQTVPQLCVPQQSTASQPPRLVSRSGQLQEQGFSVEVVERIAAPQRLSTRTIYKSKWALFQKWCRENSVDFSTPSIKQVSDFLCTCTKI